MFSIFLHLFSMHCHGFMRPIKCTYVNVEVIGQNSSRLPNVRIGRTKLTPVKAEIIQKIGYSTLL